MQKVNLLPLLAVGIVLLLSSPSSAWEARPYALVHPIPGKSQLKIAEDGLQILREVAGTVAPIVVIGPYRSGKSFLLNQLLGVRCNEGFGVGHTRETETKGIWIWGIPEVLEAGTAKEHTILYIDTEGFESTGRSNSYDDRIFAVATVLSSLLIYNLPETIRGSDVAKLSFAVDLAAGFYDQMKGSQGVPVEPGNMLWLIQRDFLQGKSVQQLVDEALAPVPNPGHDKDIAGLNRIRESLATIASNSTGFSLPQPHLDRTKLCELSDSELDPKYLHQRDALRNLVKGLVKPKAVGGARVTGAQLAELLQSLVRALNDKDIPTAAGLIESFNREIISKALGEYGRRMDLLKLPVDASTLKMEDAAARDAALKLFESQLLGRRMGGGLKATLIAGMDKESKGREMANQAESNTVCQDLEMNCERLLDRLGVMQVPSMRRFEASYKDCQERFQARCVGPARAKSDERLGMAWKRAHGQFAKDYNDRLYTGLVVTSLVAIVLFRFLVKLQVMEALGWVCLVFLEVYPRVYHGASGFYETRWWKATATVWEWCMLLLFSWKGLALVVVVGGGSWVAWNHYQRIKPKKVVQAYSKGDIRDLDV